MCAFRASASELQIRQLAEISEAPSDPVHPHVRGMPGGMPAGTRMPGGTPGTRAPGAAPGPAGPRVLPATRAPRNTAAQACYTYLPFRSSLPDSPSIYPTPAPARHRCLPMGSIVSIISAAYRTIRCKRNVQDAPADDNCVYQDSNFASEVPAAPTKFASRHAWCSAH